jgi:quinol-cytochrome oxidoreductase complex cytochrome b subunit
VGTLGDLATASFVIAAASGVVLAVPYDSADGYGSIATVLLVNPAGVLFRNMHYWSGQLCFVLTLWHVWDHLRATTEHRVRVGVWLRLTLTLPLVAFIMLSGFLLRGDADAQQALRILTEVTTQIPLAGPGLATLIFGVAGQLDLVYIQHAATATIVVWLFVIEHSRRVWPRSTAFLVVLGATGALSLVLSPGLHDGLDPVVKGPWYFLGLQEILHWTPWPTVVILGLAGVLAAVFAVRLSPVVGARRIKIALLVMVVLYGGLCGVGAFFRGENWAWAPGWPTGSSNVRVGWIFASTPEAPATLPTPLPMAMNRPEGCLVCHTEVTGLGSAHSPEAIGCASCHGGDILTLDKARAHARMETIAGNMATAQLRCGQSACHATIIPRVERSVMSTMSGIVAVNRTVFGETVPLGRSTHVRDLGTSAADTHVRQLCAGCHLGVPKTALGPATEDATGGGCIACHLSYSPEALTALGKYEAAKGQGAVAPPRQHLAISLDISNGQCFGCHSRSGRISTSYEGWNELHDPPAEAFDPGRPIPSHFRVLADERVFERVTPDVHQQAGLDCIDCHTANEVMGDGVAHARKSGQLRVTCEDCHAAPGRALPTVPASQLDPESKRILALRKWPSPAATRFVTSASGDVLVNVVIGPGGQPQLVRKRTGELRPLKPALAVCTTSAGHDTLSCGSCHTAWAPRCTTCHTSFDPAAEAYDWVSDKYVTGAWREKAGSFVANAPTLGVRRIDRPTAGRSEVVETFVPGMIMTLDRNRDPNKPSDVMFRRLYARIEPHTTRREVRSCESCHNNPEALGYGRGVLRLERTAAGGRWAFTPGVAPLAQDGLPADAWIPFLGTRTDMVSTRDDVRPFTVEEQRKILRVGACLTCHPGGSAVMRDSIRDFAAVLSRRSARCVSPVWH